MQGGSDQIDIAAEFPVVDGPNAIDISNVAELRTALLRAGAHGSGTVILDLSRTEFCDSAGLSVMIRARRRALAEGGELRLVVATPQVQRILSVTGLDRWFPCFTRLDAALMRSHDVRDGR
jgi:anti-sigma B factor antagonist